MALSGQITNNRDSTTWAATPIAAGNRSTGALSQTTTFTLRVESDAGQVVEKPVTVQVGNAPVINSFTIDSGASKAVLVGFSGTVALAWNVTGAATVAITDVSGTPSPTTGNTTVTPVTTSARTKTYTLTATNDFGITTATVTLYVDARPTATFTVNGGAGPVTIAPMSAEAGTKNATIAWNVGTDAVSIRIMRSQGGVPLVNTTTQLSGSVFVNSNDLSNGTGSFYMDIITTHGVETYHVDGAGDIVYLVVNAEALLDTTFTADDYTITPGSSTTLRWTATGGS